MNQHHVSLVLDGNRVIAVGQSERRIPKGLRAPVPLPSMERLRIAFTCDAERGTLTWNYNAAMPPAWNTRYAGKIAGYRAKSGYVITAIDGVKYRSHRIIWKM